MTSAADKYDLLRFSLEAGDPVRFWHITLTGPNGASMRTTTYASVSEPVVEFLSEGRDYEITEVDVPGRRTE